jgi:hypothetical protein
MPNPNAVKGHNWERKFIIDIKSFWPYAESTRSSSRKLDDTGVDVNGVPPLIQLKATEMRPNFQKLYEKMITQVDKLFPPHEAKEMKKRPYVVIHKDTTRRAGKGKPHVETMTFDYQTGLLLLELYAKHLEDG